MRNCRRRQRRHHNKSFLFISDNILLFQVNILKIGNPHIVVIYPSSYIVSMFCKCTCSGLIDILIQAQVMILWGFLNTFIKVLSTVRVWMGGIVGKLIFKIEISQIGVFYITLLEYSVEKMNGILAEWGRHGSVWADTLGKWSHRLQEGF